MRGCVRFVLFSLFGTLVFFPRIFLTTTISFYCLGRLDGEKHGTYWTNVSSFPSPCLCSVFLSPFTSGTNKQTIICI